MHMNSDTQKRGYIGYRWIELPNPENEVDYVSRSKAK